MSRISKVTTLSLPPKMVAEANKIAKEENRTKSELFREALRLYIEMRRWQKIRKWGEKTVLEKDIKEKDVDDLINDVRKGA
jgi:CopG family transcriptional regulator/antitoxin EndoAI